MRKAKEGRLKSVEEELTLRQKIGLRIMTGLPGEAVDADCIHMVEEYKISNFALFHHNIRDNGQLSRLCAELQELVLRETGHGALIAIDQEGGTVTRLGTDGINIPGAMAIAATGDPKNAYTAGLITGHELRNLGVNMDCAPVLDVNSNPENPVIGVRSYGDTPDTVIRYGLEMQRGLTDAGILCCAKHFPGHGNTSVDSHLSLPLVEKDLSGLLQTELVPFQAAIGQGISAIMTAHILFPALEKNMFPATLSRTILMELLKKRLGFQGLVVTDCLEMNAIQSFCGTVQGAVLAAQAGADLMLISHNGHLAAQAVLALEEAYRAGKLNPTEQEASVKKIIALKARYAVPSGRSPQVDRDQDRETVRKIRQAGITLVHAPGGKLPPLGNRPCFLSSVHGTVSQVANPNGYMNFARFFSEKLGGEIMELPEIPTLEDIGAAACKSKDFSSLVVGLDSGAQNIGMFRLAEKWAEAGIPVIVIALRSPYVLKGMDPRFSQLCIYEYSALSLEALAEVLTGKETAVGILPVVL